MAGGQRSFSPALPCDYTLIPIRRLILGQPRSKNTYFYGCACWSDTAECEQGIGQRHVADPSTTAGEMEPSPSSMKEHVMDDQQFDRLTASLAQAGSRRTALRGLAAVLGLGGVSLLATGTTARRRRHHGHRGGGGGGGGGGNGGGGGGADPCAGVDCPANTVCRNGTCVPAPDRCGGPTGICNADPTPCGTSATGETCGCERTVEGNTVCVDGANACPQVVECTSTQDCEDRLGFHFFCQEAKTNAQGQFCGCGFGTATGRVCVAECDNADAFAAESRTGKQARRT